MTNYENIINQFSIEQLAEYRVKKVFAVDEFDGLFVAYETSNNKIYNTRDEALKAEIEWLKEEAEL